MATAIETIEALHQRLERARQIVADDMVSRVLGMDDHYTVESAENQGAYLINGTCSCPDAQYRSELTNGVCKHRLAVLLYVEQQGKDGD